MRESDLYSVPLSFSISEELYQSSVALLRPAKSFAIASVSGRIVQEFCSSSHVRQEMRTFSSSPTFLSFTQFLLLRLAFSSSPV